MYILGPTCGIDPILCSMMLAPGHSFSISVSRSKSPRSLYSSLSRYFKNEKQNQF